jgi:hypothetical protein
MSLGIGRDIRERNRCQRREKGLRRNEKSLFFKSQKRASDVGEEIPG